MASAPLVSVIIPAWNAGATLAEAVDSALRQTLGDLEVIVVDDASTDNTAQILASISDPRLRVLRHPQNKGEGAARNTAMAAAAGRWIALLDADDAWDPRRLERLLAAADRSTQPVMLADNIMHCYTTEAGLRPWKAQWSRSQFDFTGGAALLDTVDYLRLTPLLIKPVFPRSVMDAGKIAYSDRVFSADTEYVLRVFKSGVRLLMVDAALYLYRRARGSMSDTPDRARIMREMFQDLSRELAFSQDEMQALGNHVRRLERDEVYLPFLRELKQGSVLRAASACVTRPWLAWEFLRRLPATVPYRFHVWLHHGHAR